MIKEEPYIEAKPYELKDLAKKLNQKDREFLMELRKQDYKEGYINGTKLITKQKSK